MNDLNLISDVTRLEKIILSALQVDLMTEHSLSGGVYARTIYLDAGCVLTGATHKKDHINIVVGDITVTTDKGPLRLTGHHVLETKAGAKRAGVAHAKTVWTTVCATDKTDLHEIEDDLVLEADRLQTRQTSLNLHTVKELE